MDIVDIRVTFGITLSDGFAKKTDERYDMQGILFSKKIPTDPWNRPQTLNYLFMKEILSYLYLGVLTRGLLKFS